MAVSDVDNGDAATAIVNHGSGTGPSSIGPARGDASDCHLSRGTSLGRYVVLDQLGAGGMGVVYMGYDPDLDRKVALKLLRPVSNAIEGTEKARIRLQREAQAMARLSHPNVVSVYDVGTLGDQVFIAVEYVEGVDMREWLKARRSWREIRDLMIEAGRGLAAAHRAGVIHRDFKPANVLVGERRVAVMDFGLAFGWDESNETWDDHLPDHMTSSQESPLATPLTQANMLVGTPPYLAPELHTGGRPDPSTDQFAFCVSLFEALYGERPYQGESRAEMFVAMTDGDIVTPKDRRGVPSWLHRVVVRGLAPSPADRHPSMEAVLEALDRDPAATRRRVTAVATLCLGAAAAAYGLRSEPAAAVANPCENVATDASTVWNDDVRDALKPSFASTGSAYAAQAFDRTASTLDDYVQRWQDQRVEACEATWLEGAQSEALLDLRMQCLDMRLHQAHALIELMHDADAAMVERAVSAASNLPALDRCADREALRSEIPPPEDPSTQQHVEDLQETLANLAAARDLAQWQRAEKLVDGLVDRASSTEYAPIEAQALVDVGVFWRQRGQLDAAVEHLHEGILASEATGQDRLVIRGMSALMYIRGVHQADAEQASRLAEQLQAKLERIDASPELRADAKVYEGIVALSKHDLETAERMFQAAIEMYERLEDPPLDELSMAVNNLGVVFARKDRPKKALPHHERALRLRRQVLGSDHPSLGAFAGNVGMLHLMLGHVGKAKMYYELAIERGEQAGPDHFKLAYAYISMANVLFFLGEHEQGIAYVKKSQPIILDKVGPEHFLNASAMHYLAEHQRALGHYQQARELHRQALDLRRKLFSDKEGDAALSLHGLALVDEDVGAWNRARARLDQALKILKAGANTRDHLLANVHHTRARVFLELGQIQAARAELETALQHVRAASDEGSWLEAYPLATLGRIEAKAGNRDTAIETMQRAIALYRTEPGNPALLGHMHFDLAKLLTESAPGRARRSANRAWHLWKDAEGVSPEAVADLRAWRRRLPQP